MLKGVSLGGFFVWYLIDYGVCIYIALSKAPSISMMGYSADFEESTIESAYWLCLALVILNFLTQAYGGNSAREQHDVQKEQYEKLAATICKRNDVQGGTIWIPRSDRALAYVPTVLVKSLRKSGVISGQATLPEMIKLFATLDKNGDGQLDRAEITEAIVQMGVTTDTDLDEVLKQCDTNGDGKISQQEFLEQFFERHEVR